MAKSYLFNAEIITLDDYDKEGNRFQLLILAFDYPMMVDFLMAIKRLLKKCHYLCPCHSNVNDKDIEKLRRTLYSCPLKKLRDFSKTDLWGNIVALTALARASYTPLIRPRLGL